MNWEDNRQDDIRALTAKGILPMAKQAEEDKEAGGELDFEAQMDRMPLLMGQASGAIEEIQTAQEIMEVRSSPDQPFMSVVSASHLFACACSR